MTNIQQMKETKRRLRKTFIDLLADGELGMDVPELKHLCPEVLNEIADGELEEQLKEDGR